MLFSSKIRGRLPELHLFLMFDLGFLHYNFSFMETNQLQSPPCYLISILYILEVIWKTISMIDKGEQIRNNKLMSYTPSSECKITTTQ